MTWKNSIGAVVVSLSISVAAQAALVTYETQGSFDGTRFSDDVSSDYLPCNTDDPCTGGRGTRLLFAGAALSTVDAPSNAGLGAFILQSLTSSPALDSLVGLKFWLRVIQTSPIVGEDTVIGTAAGRINRVSARGAEMKFESGDLVVGPITYHLTNAFFEQTDTIGLIAPGVDNGLGRGVTTIQAQVESAAIPEPSSLFLLGSALMVVGVFSRRFVR